MSDITKEITKKEVALRKEAHRWEMLSDSGFIGLVVTELPEFLVKEGGKKPAWRLPLFFASGASIVAGVVMNWIKGGKANALRDSLLEMENKQCVSEPGQWRAKIAAQQNTPNTMGK